MSTNLWRGMMEMATLISVLPGAYSMDRPFDFAYPTTQTQPEMGGTGGGGKTRNGFMDGGDWDDFVPGNLATRELQPNELVPFFRELEQAALSGSTKPTFVYWSTLEAARLLPTGPMFRDLIRDAYCLSIFSEGRSDLPDVSVICIFSDKGSAFIEMREVPGSSSYKCFGSIDSNMTVKRMKALFDRFHHIDMAEKNRLVGKLEGVPFNSTNMSIFGAFYKRWMNQK